MALLIVLLMIVELHVEAPEEVTERERADLTCNTTCSLTDPTFIWYKDGHPLTKKTIKNNQLHLQTVSSEDAGSYSCAVRGDQHLRSTAHSLRVRDYSMILYGVVGVGLCGVAVFLAVFFWKRARNKDEPDYVNSGVSAPLPRIDLSSVDDYVNMTNRGLRAPPTDDVSSSTPDYENMTFIFDEKASKKEGLYKAGGQTRVNIDVAFQLWQNLKELKGLESNTKKAGLRVPLPEDDSSSAHDYENMTELKGLESDSKVPDFLLD
ncbi:hypothetical protein MHYP_G00103160 [Metynnis hypsauchen]